MPAGRVRAHASATREAASVSSSARSPVPIERTSDVAGSWRTEPGRGPENHAILRKARTGARAHARAIAPMRTPLRAWMGAPLRAWMGAPLRAWMGAPLRAWMGAPLRAWMRAPLRAWMGAPLRAWIGVLRRPLRPHTCQLTAADADHQHHRERRRSELDAAADRTATHPATPHAAEIPSAKSLSKSPLVTSVPSEVGVPTPPPQRRPHKGCSRCEDRGRAANAAWHVPRPGGTRRPPPLERARRPGSRGAVHGCLSSRAQSDGRSPTQPGGGGRPGARGGSRGAPKSAAGGAGNGEAGGAGAQRAARRVLSYQVVPSRPGRVHTPGSRRGVAGASPALSAFEASPGCPLGHANLTY
eukprot:gene17037-biopygen5526